MMQRTDTLFRKVKREYADATGQDVLVLMVCYSHWDDDVKYVVSVVGKGSDEAVAQCESWSPRAALKEALHSLVKVNGGGSTLSIVKSASVTSDASEKN